ncbi:MAG: TolC family protein, partial [Smithella sp.]
MIRNNLLRIFFILIVFTFVYPSTVFAGTTLTLEESIDIALQNSIVLNMAREGSKGAVAQKNEAMTGFLPKFSTSYNYTRLNEEPFTRFQGLPAGPLSFMNGLEVPMGTKDNFNWVIEARQPLFAGGGIWANYQASRIGEDIARQEETAKYQDVVQEVKVAYFNVLRAQKIQEA